MEHHRDYYYVLGVPRNATKQEITKSYRNLALSLHPDKNGDTPQATTRFQQLNEAYNFLMNEKSRAKYDAEEESRVAEIEAQKKQRRESVGTMIKERQKKIARAVAEAASWVEEQPSVPSHKRRLRNPLYEGNRNVEKAVPPSGSSKSNADTRNAGKDVPLSGSSKSNVGNLQVKMDPGLREIAIARLAAKRKADAEAEEEKKKRVGMWKLVESTIAGEIAELKDKLGRLIGDLAWCDAVDARSVAKELCDVYGPAYTKAFIRHLEKAEKEDHSNEAQLRRYLSRALYIRDIERVLMEIETKEQQLDTEWERIWIPEGQLGLMDRDFNLFQAMVKRQTATGQRRVKFSQDKINREKIEEKRSAHRY